MGSKKLKAIVVNGKRKVGIAREEKLNNLWRKIVPTMKTGTGALAQFGTSAGLVLCENIGDLPIKNWYQGKWEQGAGKICGPTMAKTILAGRYACGRCVIGCA